MKKIRKIYSVFAMLGLVVGLLMPFANNTLAVENVYETSVFTDVPDDAWYCTYVEYLYERGIVKGLTETEFVPNGNVTVAESAALITRYLGLENEAAKRKEAMVILGTNGSDKWFAGYVQLMHEAGIMDVTSYGCTLNGTSVSIDNPDLFNEPVKRYEFAAFIARSFELYGTGINTPDGTYGSSFINGGSYDQNVLANIEPYINDYWRIPHEYAVYVLKTYYNGIFNGDDNGNFNPNKLLSRAEMAKVIAVVTDKSLRKDTSIYFQSVQPDNSGYMLTEDSFTEYKGVKYLKNSVSDELLAGEVSNCLAIDYTYGGVTLTYKPSMYYPAGYTVKPRLYRKTSSAYYSEEALVDTNGVYQCAMRSGDKLLFVLCDTSQNRAVDAYEITLSVYGLLENSYCNYLP